MRMRRLRTCLRFQTCQDRTLRNLPRPRAPVKPVERDRLRQSLLIVDLLSTRSLKDYVVMLLQLLLEDWSIWSADCTWRIGAFDHSDHGSCFPQSAGRSKRVVSSWSESWWTIGKTVIGTYVELHTAAQEMVEDSDRARPFDAVVWFT